MRRQERCSEKQDCVKLVVFDKIWTPDLEICDDKRFRRNLEAEYRRCETFEEIISQGKKEIARIAVRVTHEHEKRGDLDPMWHSHEWILSKV